MRKLLLIILFSTFISHAQWVYFSSGMGNNTVLSLAAHSNYMYAGTYSNGVYISTNNGVVWTQSSLGSNHDIRSIAINDNYVFAGVISSSSGLYMSSNNGTNWTQTLNSYAVMSIALCGNNVFAGLNNYSVWRRPLSELVGIKTTSNENPSDFSLSQNYPNPFNPTTKIRFEISGTSAAQTFLSVYDMLGREVVTLVNEELKPGTYEVDWSAEGGANNYPSGVYFYKLITESYTETKRMVLIK